MTTTMNLFKPSPRYLTRLRVVMSFWAGFILIAGILIAGLVSLDTQHIKQAWTILQAVFIADLIWYLPAMRLAKAAYEARTYCISDDEIIIQSGWWTKSIHHIPLGSVVDLEMRWDRLDLWLEIGSLDVRTTTKLTKHGSKLRLDGLADVDMVGQLAARQLKNLRDSWIADRAFPAGSRESNRLSLRHQF